MSDSIFSSEAAKQTRMNKKKKTPQDKTNGAQHTATKDQRGERGGVVCSSQFSIISFLVFQLLLTQRPSDAEDEHLPHVQTHRGLAVRIERSRQGVAAMQSAQTSSTHSLIPRVQQSTQTSSTHSFIPRVQQSTQTSSTHSFIPRV